MLPIDRKAILSKLKLITKLKLKLITKLKLKLLSVSNIPDHDEKHK